MKKLAKTTLLTISLCAVQSNAHADKLQDAKENLLEVIIKYSKKLPDQVATLETHKNTWTIYRMLQMHIAPWMVGLSIKV